MPTPNLVRGAVLKCSFPYDSAPTQPGPLPHYCLYIDSVEVEGSRYVAVCYGTSRLDEELLRAHSGAVLSVASQFIKGDMPSGVAHFVCNHVAAIPEAWIYGNFVARLDFIRAERRRTDQRRQRLYEAFEAVEDVMERAALDVLNHFTSTGRIGLPSGTTLR